MNILRYCLHNILGISFRDNIVELGVLLALAVALLILAIAVIIRIGTLIKNIWFKKSTNQFRTLLMFRKWFASGLDVLIIASLVAELNANEIWFVFFIALCVGIRIALYFAIRAEEKKKLK